VGKGNPHLLLTPVFHFYSPGPARFSPSTRGLSPESLWGYSPPPHAPGNSVFSSGSPCLWAPCPCVAQHKRHRLPQEQWLVTQLAWSCVWEPATARSLLRVGLGGCLRVRPGRGWAVCTPQSRDCPADLHTRVPKLAFSSCLIFFLFAFKL